MNRRTKHPKPHQNITAGQLQILNADYSWNTLTANERKKCRQKFEAYRPPGSDTLSKYELQRMLKELGIEMSEEEVLEKMWEIDPKSQGYVSLEAFMKSIEAEKEKKFVEVTNFIGLTFDSVLAEQRLKYKDDSLEEITWDFLRYYFSENFEIDINVNAVAGKKSSSKSLNRNEFMSVFS